MSTPFLKKLASVFVVLLILWVVYLYRQVPHERLPFAKVADAADKLVIQQGPRAVQLSKDDKTWKVLLNGNTVSADMGHVKELLASLKALQLDGEISDNPERAPEFEIDAASGTHISLQNAKGATLAEGIFGKQAPDISHIYFRFTDKPNVYLARGLFRGDIGKMDPGDWRSRQLVDIPESKMVGILVHGPDFTTDLVAVSTEAWTMNGKPVDAGRVNALVGTIAHVRVLDFVDATLYPKLTYESLSYARLNIKGMDSAVELRIGPLDAKSKRYPVSVGKDTGLAWLPQPLVNSLLQKPAAFQTK